MSTVVCALLKNEHDQYLVVQRSATMPHPLAWEFPGGKVQQGESLEEALKRELREELDIEVDLHDQGHRVVHAYAEGKQIILHPFMGKIKTGLPNLKEHQGLKWLSIQELHQLIGLLDADVKLLKLHPDL